MKEAEYEKVSKYFGQCMYMSEAGKLFKGLMVGYRRKGPFVIVHTATKVSSTNYTDWQEDCKNKRYCIKRM